MRLIKVIVLIGLVAVLLASNYKLSKVYKSSNIELRDSIDLSDTLVFYE